jgi:tRNA dimethylallyltransferase
VIRALEIIERTGKAPICFKNTQAAFSYSKCFLLPPLASLEPRIKERTKSMLESGWLAEVKQLLANYPYLATAKQALGYNILATHLNGEISLDDAKEHITQATLNYAKRQRTWFRKEAADLKPEKLAKDAKAEVMSWLASL